MAVPVLSTELPGLDFVGRGKVRDIWRVPGDPHHLVIVATDRISAFDVVMPNGIPGKGEVLTALSTFWFQQLGGVVPNHLVTSDVAQMPEPVRRHAATLRGRTMYVRQCEPFPVECVARGYLAGSGLKEYRVTGEVCGIKLPPALLESDKLPEPIFTPATKAATGHDENIDFATFATILGEKTAVELRRLTLELFRGASAFAASRGILLCDTKFEFGLLGGNVTLIDEALTPDSSRYWDATLYQPGKPQPSFDKQPVRDWLEKSGWDKKPPSPALPEEIVQLTTQRYREIYKRLTGKVIA